jgi:hypothetical protein
MNQPKLFLHYLAGIFESPLAASDGFHQAGPVRAVSFFLRNHVLMFPVIITFNYLSLTRMISGNFRFELKLLYPVLFITAISILASLFDKISEAWKGPSIEGFHTEASKNTALFLTLPLLSTGPFFFLHPALGYLFLLIFTVYFTMHSVTLVSLYQGLTPARAWVIWLFSVFLLIVPLIAFLGFFNILTSIQIFRMY